MDALDKFLVRYNSDLYPHVLRIYADSFNTQVPMVNNTMLRSIHIVPFAADLFPSWMYSNILDEMDKDPGGATQRLAKLLMSLYDRMLNTWISQLEGTIIMQMEALQKLTGVTFPNYIAETEIDEVFFKLVKITYFNHVYYGL